ncbi:MAG: leucyl/phenylalanyl-tRNA--protein transferase [Bacteroidales bacterium]|nr:leucyl/phenylalanyl-tRNA--protein transferase [Bacteroidales bacterium]
MIYQLPKDEISFPDPRKCQGEDDGLLAIGGDLSVDRLILAYSNGIFPWYPFRSDLIQWYCPMQRFVIFTNEIHVSHSMRTLFNSGVYYCTINTSFAEVIANCGKVAQRNEHQLAWLGDNIIEAYTKLHELGYAMSVETRRTADNELIGGLYGVAIGSCFCGESMFSFEPNGSKYALISLANLMSRSGLQIIDCQFETPHLRSMGGRHISYDEYMKYL